ncbi:MAG: MarR family winged helix-turn-helix transcriptional regulator [Steroidobacteraceae bacterium]
MEAGSTLTGARRRQSKPWKRITQVQSLCSYWLKGADRHVSNSFAGRLKACGLLASEWAAVRYLYGPLRRSPVEVGAAIGMTKGGASKLVDRLVKKGLAIKTVGEYDRRFRSVELTEAGRNLVPRFARFVDKTNREIFGNLNRRRRLLRALKRVVHNPRQRERMDMWHVPRSRGSPLIARAYGM